MAGVSVAAGGGAAEQGSQGGTSVDGDAQAAFGQALSQAKRDDGQQAGAGEQNSRANDGQTQGHDDAATCTVEVRTKEIGATGNVARHAAIVTTEHSSRDETDTYFGKQTVHRGGPEARVQTPTDGTRFGDIINDTAIYAPNGLDYPADGVPHPSVDVGTYQGDCDAIDKKLEAAGNEIEREGHDYWPLSQNSNSAAREMLERSGLPQPSDPYGWTPGWQTDLPQRPPVKNVIN